MFGIVEFEHRNCAVVPLNWLIDDEKQCYWPRASSKQAFEKMVVTCKQAANSWPKYPVVKIFNVTGMYAVFCDKTD